MKIAIIGPGAIGTLIAAHLARAKNEVWFLDNTINRAQSLRKKGVRVEGLSKIAARVNASVNAKEIGTTDAVILCVKSYDTDDALSHVKEIIDENSFILSLQNGIGNIQLLNDTVGEARVIAGITSHAATLISPGIVRHTGKGETIIGRTTKSPIGKARLLLELLNKSGITTRSTKDINSLIWSKLIINSGINALSAITHLKNGLLLEYPYTKDIMRSAVAEAARIAKKKRIKLQYDDPFQKVESVCKNTANNISSMLQDVLQKHKTEIDFINGAIARQGKQLGIATPVNETLTYLVKAIESSYSKQQ